MQAADDVQFGHADVQGGTSFLDDFLNGQLESIGIPLLFGESAKLAAQDAVVGVVNIAINDVAGTVAVFALADQLGNGADGVEVFGFEQAKGVGIGNALTGCDFVVQVLKI